MQGDAPRHKSNHLRELVLVGLTIHLLSLALIVYAQEGQKEVHYQKGQKQTIAQEKRIMNVSKICAPTQEKMITQASKGLYREYPRCNFYL